MNLQKLPLRNLKNLRQEMRAKAKKNPGMSQFVKKVDEAIREKKEVRHMEIETHMLERATRLLRQRRGQNVK